MLAPNWKPATAGLNRDGRSSRSPWCARSGASVCFVNNLSATGALVSVDLALEIDEDVVFEVEEIGEIPSRVMRRQGSLFGLMFKLEAIDDVAVRDWLAEINKEGEL